jgi:hypothetical protein
MKLVKDGTADDPVGVETARAILDTSLTLAALPVWREPFVTVLGFALMAGSLTLSLRVVHNLILAHIPEAG